MSFPANSAANEFLKLAQKARRSLTNMQVQKLVYIAHGFDLAVYDVPLITESVEAWPWGPVIPPLYKRLKNHGRGPITELIGEPVQIPEIDKSYQLVMDVWEGYGGYTAAQLSAITHRTGSPWDVTWRMEPSKVIDDALTAEYYKSLLAR